jgi:predicted nuclease of predicted toxin-antitoxin system
MKFKLDENLPIELVDLLAAHGHDVHTVPGESLTGRNDTIIFNAAVAECRLFLT